MKSSGLALIQHDWYHYKKWTESQDEAQARLRWTTTPTSSQGWWKPDWARLLLLRAKTGNTGSRAEPGSEICQQMPRQEQDISDWTTTFTAMCKTKNWE